MRRVDYLVTEARRISKNDVNTDGTLATTDEEIIRYINDAQDELQGLISSLKGVDSIFNTEEIISIVGNQESYSLTKRLFVNKEIDLVEYSATGSLTDYVVLDKTSIFNRDTNTSSYPAGYWRRQGKVFVTPIPSSSTGSLRVSFEQTLDDLDKRRGKVSVVTGLTSTSFTSITIDSTADETSNPNLSTIDYVCIVDKDGARKAYNIPVGNYDTGTNVLTPTAGFTFLQSGDSIAVGDYVVFGKWTTTHSGLPDDCESYLIHFAAEMLLHKDSSNDMKQHTARRLEMRAQILKSLASQTAEIQRIPQFNRYEWW